MKQFIFLLTLVFLFVLAACKEETPTSPPNDNVSWTTVDTGLASPNASALAVSPAVGGAGGTNLFAGTDGGVFLSTNNGTSWIAARTGLLPGTSYYALAVSSTNLFTGTSRGVWQRPL